MIRYMFRTLLILLTLVMTACVSEVDAPFVEEGGRLQLSLANISTATRSTPSELGVPSNSDFRLRIISPSGRTVYDDAFTENEITLPVASYSILVTYGSNAELAIDQPYYSGEATVEIKEKEVSHVDINVSVANALVSAVFGEDETERARFDRFYSDYALYVCIGNRSIPITKTSPAKSVYVKAGSHVTLRFWGKLKMEDDREVSMELESNDFPATLSAADHAIVTLTLPDPESALGVNISKVELETLTLDETIPLSWLPVPQATPTHQFDAQGNLVGTKVEFSNSYPGMTWKTVVTNVSGAEVRSLQGTGALTSDYTDSAEWPYLPQGKYTATYYIVSADGSAKRASSREFVVPAPTGLELTLGGYTSYTKYLEGNIDAANACDRLTVYEPSVKLNISETLLSNSHYSYTFTYTYDGTQHTVAAGKNAVHNNNIENQAVRRAPYILKANATFDGVTLTEARRDFIITGLPYSLNLQSHDEWTASGGVDWFENDVRLGHLSTGSQYIQTTTSVCIPPLTYICADYSVNVHVLTVGTYLSITVGDMEILKIEEEGTPFRDTDNLHSGTTNVCHDESNYATRIHCYNDYGAGQTCSHIYSFTLKYANRQS